ncbi:peptidoglycan-binding protein [Flavivirga algicola]|uniref:Peptidoglycan-binding protein n=1 Tax=Flavivirga algicola TaxID=2729136 RepID=A0ABX1RTS6_9FLAO|nr:peptidoglycan-binding protein [Flavivirga algicola]NMH86571.1 peptidoglycan-binding protein [Flavivirga algicola]
MNRIPDFSYAGYKNSEVPIPNIPVVYTIKPIEGDNTNHIQKAIDSVGKMPLNEHGFRGTLLLKAGSYSVSGTIYIKYSGVVVRGEGDGENISKNTVINAIGNTPENRTILIAGGNKNYRLDDDWEWGSRSFITSDFVQVGSHEFEVENPSLYKKGDHIVIKHPCTQKWLEVNEWGVNNDKTKFWHEGELPIVYNRYIKKIEGNKITIDAPVFNHLDKSLSRSFIYKYNRKGLLTNIGIENLRIDIHTLGRNDIKNHAENAIALRQIEDAWVKNCTMLHFWKSGVVTETAFRISVIDTKALQPYGVVTGGQRYNFNASNYSQQILFYHCHASNSRHAYVSNGRSTVSGVAVVECTSTKSYTASEGHQKWSQGLLFDNLNEIETRSESEGGNRIMGFYNRGNWANGHGWSTVHSVLWNCNARGKAISVQKPPTGQNYAIGCFGVVSGKGPFKGPIGYIEGSNKKELYPKSLFKAQYRERTGKEFDVLKTYDTSF